MKFQAFILFIAASIYLTETVKLPFALLQSSRTSQCCAKMKMAKMSCHQQKQSEKNPASKCNDMNCSNCPLGYISTFQPGIVFETSVNYIENKYPLLKNNYVSEYIFKAWKPPDTI